MSLIERLVGEQVSGIVRGVVAETRGAIIVRLAETGTSVRCEALHTSDKPLLLVEGDDVLVWRETERAEWGVLIGRIGPSRAELPAAESIPDDVLLEAKHALTLRVGDGSITIHKDGKILIKGKDLVSHAQRMNRIKGGAVSIN